MDRTSTNLLLKNAGILASSQIVARALVMALQIVLINVLPRDEWGLFVIAFGYFHLVGQFTDFGLRTHTLREVSTARSSAAHFVGELISLRLLIGAATLVVLLPAFHLLGYARETLLVLMVAGLGGILEYLSQNLKTVFRAFERTEFDALASLANRALLFVIVLGLIGWGRADALSVVGAMTAMALLELVFVVRLMRPLTGCVPRLARPSRRLARLLRSAAVLFLVTLSIDVVRRLPAILLERWNGRDAAAVYGTAGRLFEAGAFVPVALMGAVLPRIVQIARAASAKASGRQAGGAGASGVGGAEDHRFDIADGDQRRAAASAYGALVFVMFLILAGPLLFTILEAPRIVRLLFSEEYLDAVPAFRVLAGWLLAVAMANVAGNPLLVAHRERIMLAAGVATAGLLALMMLLLVRGQSLLPAQAALAGAWSMLAADASLCLLMLAADWRLGLVSMAPLWRGGAAGAKAASLMLSTIVAAIAGWWAVERCVPADATMSPLLLALYAATAGAMSLAIWRGMGAYREAVRRATAAGVAAG
jgi:O-antigen/teichoic acid export membrane protein